jgi:phosphate acetyltransferase
MLFQTLPQVVRERLLSLAAGATIALPEGEDERIRDAARILEQSAGIRSVLLDTQSALQYEQLASQVIRGNIERRGRQPTAEQLSRARDPLFVAGAMLELGQVDAVVAGAVATTPQVIRAVLATVGTQPSVPLITSCFLFRLNTPTAGGEDVVLYADAGVIPQPSVVQISQIAALSAQAYESWTGREARVGFLSFSTHGSADHPDVQKMRDAAASFAQSCPQWLSEGEIQFDAAVVPEVARRKNPATRLAGRTNVFVFPDLDAGNIAYKVTQRLAGAEAWGPLLLGAAKPFSDLSRGASAFDIAHVALLTLALGRSTGH